MSTSGNHGKLHTLFLREDDRKGELIELNDLYFARRKLVSSVLLSPKKKMDMKLVSYGHCRDDVRIGHA